MHLVVSKCGESAEGFQQIRDFQRLGLNLTPSDLPVPKVQAPFLLRLELSWKPGDSISEDAEFLDSVEEIDDDPDFEDADVEPTESGEEEEREGIEIPALTIELGETALRPSVLGVESEHVECTVCRRRYLPRAEEYHRKYICKKPTADATISIERLPFSLLPPGQWGLRTVLQYYERAATRTALAHRRIDEGRLEMIQSLNPKPIRCWVGEDQWTGYVTFEFSETTSVVLECPLYGNATYLIHAGRDEWKRLVGQSKAILLAVWPDQVERVIHHGEAWLSEVSRKLAKGTRRRRGQKR